MTRDEKSVLFVCIENSSRSQMAEAFAKGLGLNASSAGTVPSTQVNTYVVEAMSEKGIDISRERPKKLTAEMVDRAGTVVLMDETIMKTLPRGLRWKMRKKHTEWPIPDPQGRSLEAVKEIRDEVEMMVNSFARTQRSTIPEHHN